VIDLHSHTTASDGACTPRQLVARAARAGITTLAVTDHDTCDGLAEAAEAAGRLGIEFVPGIEITAVWQGSDVHMLAYFVDPADSRFAVFLDRQRRDRERRGRQIAERLASLGMPIDIERAIAEARPATISRPRIAQALVAAGFSPTPRAAFGEWLGEGRPAFVSRVGAQPAEVVELVLACGGAVSMAHPALTDKDTIIPDLVRRGLTALEVFHSDHRDADVEHYTALAADLGIMMTGGSDYHGTEDGRVFGRSYLSREQYDRFRDAHRAGRREVR
jgi:3',5'-nucleoside bisphosphate phosphatase